MPGVPGKPLGPLHQLLKDEFHIISTISRNTYNCNDGYLPGGPGGPLGPSGPGTPPAKLEKESKDLSSQIDLSDGVCWSDGLLEMR